ncbi:hypothetical protein HDU78_003927 [Chytriomyces hyalinus]|nr:hypothetical protein HDU78_003927 [Chytriomyces hyalinus]
MSAVEKAQSATTGSLPVDTGTPKADIYLRVYVSDSGSSVIHVDEGTLISDILLNVCTKRGLGVADLKLSLVFRDGNENSNPSPEAPLGWYKNVDHAKLVHKKTGQFMRQSVINETAAPTTSTKTSKEEVRSGTFPKAFSAFSTSASNLNSSKFGGGMFKKQPSGSDFAAESAKVLDIPENSSNNRISMQPQSAVGTNSAFADTASTITTETDALSLNPGSQLFRKTSTASDWMQRDSSLSSFASVVDKLERTDSSPKPAFLSNHGATLKKASFRSNRSRANTDGIQELTARKNSDVSALANVDDKPDKQYTKLIITLPNFRSITIRAPTDLPMDAILSFVCERHSFEFETHTFQRNDTKDTIVEMDRTLGYLTLEMKVEELFIVPEDKVYRSKYMSEDGVDVMMLQTIQGRLQVMAGSPQKLIARLTEVEGKEDKPFMDTFLLTFRYFMPAADFFKHLVSRYNCVAPENASQEDVDYFNQMKGPTQTCVVAVLKSWAENHWHDFALDAELKTQLAQFADEYLYNDDPHIRGQCPVLKNLIEWQTTKYEEMYSYYKMVERKGKVLESMILELAPDILSLQICIHNFKLFKNIHPIEFLHQIWGSDREMTPYLNFFIDRFDKESYWVATEIVMQKDIKKRIKVLTTFILTTKACQEANNFFTLFSFMSGLGLSPVSRLKKTWEGLSDKTKAVYAELEKIIDPSRNMKNYRDLLAKAVPPIVPFLPIYLKDLTFMNDGNAKMVEGMINFEKLRMMGNRVNDIVSLVAVEYKGVAQPHIQNYIAKPPVEKGMAKLKEWSLECEKAAS